jgi:hypothetical protein
MRELRNLGWDYKILKKKEDGRVRSYYMLIKSAEWPQGNMRDAIAQGNAKRRRQ